MPGGEITKGNNNVPQGIDLILEKEKPSPWAPGMKKMYFFMFFAFWGEIRLFIKTKRQMNLHRLAHDLFFSFWVF